MGLNQERTRKLTRTGLVSYTVNIPKDFVAELKWREKQKLTVILKGKSITIKDYKDKRV